MRPLPTAGLLVGLVLLAHGLAVAFLGLAPTVFVDGADADAGAEPDEPGEALAWRRLRWQDEQGRFDPAAVLQAKAQRAANVAYHASLEGAGIGRFGWTERGPFNIGGRTRSLVVHPLDPRQLFAGAVGGGIWHSTDAGASWTPVNDRFGNLAVASLAFATGNPQVLYAGTGEGFYNGDALAGGGILKSTDGGATFAFLPATTGFSHTNRIAVSPQDGQLLLVAVRGQGVLRSSNGGTTWTLVAAASNCLQVLFDPNDGNKAVADVYDGSNHRVIRSVDAGVTWATASSGLVAQPGISGRIELAYARSVPDLVYASCGTGGGLIWASTDGGDHWTVRTTSAGSGAAWYYNSLWVDPTDANILVTGAYHVHRSTDGGVTLTQISNGYINTSQPHPDVHGFVAEAGYDGVTNRRLYVVTDGGVYATADIRTASTAGGWTRQDQGYRASQFYGAAGDGGTGRITGGTQDNGHLTLQNGAANASLTFGGDGGFAAIDWNNANYIYGEYVYAQVHRSSNGGGSASYVHTGITDAGSGTTANFIAPLILDPNQSTRLYVGSQSLWRSNSARSASLGWAAVKPAVGSNISAIAVAPGFPDQVWVGHNDGRVYRTANATAAQPTWIAVDDNAGTNPLPNRYVNRIVIDRTDANRAWIALGGFTANNLQVTGDQGLTFRSLTGTAPTGLPNAPVNGLCQHPVLADHLYAATEVGVFASADGGAHWSAGNDGPADTSAEEIVFLHNSTRLLVATHGRGLWTSEVAEAAVTTAGAGCPGSPGAAVLLAGLPRLGQPLAITGLNLVAGMPGWLLLGFSDTAWGPTPLPLDLGSFGLPGCFLRTSPDLVLARANNGGMWQYVLTVPTTPGTAGGVFFLQLFSADPLANSGGFAVTDTLRCVIGN